MARPLGRAHDATPPRAPPARRLAGRTQWKRQRDEGADAALAPHKRGRKAKVVDALEAKVAELERDKRRLEDRLRKAETIIEVQKKSRSCWGYL
jgi:hypothetical protein